LIVNLKKKFIIIYYRLDKDQFNEEEKNDAQEERKRRAEENQVK